MNNRFFGWLGRTVRFICDHPSHLQRLSIIGAGVIMWPTMVGFTLIVWLGYARTPDLQSQSLNFMGLALLSSMALWGLVVVATLGIIKGFSVSGPGGVGLSLTTIADDPDVDPGAPSDDGAHGRRHS
nr:hypothetical protein [Brevundimonas diminuta]